MSTDQPSFDHFVTKRLRADKCISVAALLAALVGSAVAAYCEMYSGWRAYDDEGVLLMFHKLFLDGRVLYDDIYSLYQPLFHLFYLLVYSVWGEPLGHDSIRLVTIILWLAGAGVSAVVAYRLTSSVPLTLVTFLSSLRCMEAVCNEPGHPQALCYLLVASVVAFLSLLDGQRGAGVTFAVGVLVGMLLMTKVNIGAYAAFAVGLALSTSTVVARIAGRLTAAVGAAMVLLPAVLMRSHLADLSCTTANICALILLAIPAALSLGAGRARVLPMVLLTSACSAIAVRKLSFCTSGNNQFNVVVLMTLSIVVVVLMAHAGGRESKLAVRQWTSAILGGFLVVVAACVAVLMLGTSLRGLFEGLILNPVALSGSLLTPFRSSLAGTWIALAGVAAYCAYRRGAVLFVNRPWFGYIVGGAQFLYGLTMLVYLSLLGSSWRIGGPLAFWLPAFWPLPFIWLLGVSGVAKPQAQLSRIALMSMTVMQPLIAYPIGGSQLGPATALLPVVGVVCVMDGFRLLTRRAFASATERMLRRAGTGLTIALCLCVTFVSASTCVKRYRALTPLALPGASRVRLPSEDVRTLQRLVRRLSQPDVRAFLTYPGMDSLHLWTGKDPLTGVNANPWMTLLTDAQQERIRDAAEKCPDLVVVRNREMIAFWAQGKRVDHRPLVRYVEENFAVAETIGPYEVMMRSSKRSRP